MDNLKFSIKFISYKERAAMRAAAEEAVRLMTEYGAQRGISLEEACRAILSDVLCGESFLELSEAIYDKESIAIQYVEKDFWREAARYAHERERAKAQAYCLTMKHHKAREVARFKRQKRMLGGLG